MASELIVQNIFKSYESHQALSDITFDIKKGAIHGLIGPNGAGKSSLIRILVGIYKSDSGKIHFQGKEVSSIPSKKLGYLPEERGLYRKMKVTDHLIYLARLQDMVLSEAKERTAYWLDRMGLPDWGNFTIDQLSKGMQQKIQFIGAVIHDPEFIILDEPFSGFDPINAELLKREVLELNQQGKTVLFSTHRMDNAEEMCSEVVMINKSKICLNGSLYEVKNEFSKADFVITTSQSNKDVLTNEEKNQNYYVSYKSEHEVKNLDLKKINGLISIKKMESSLHDIFLKVAGDVE